MKLTCSHYDYPVSRLGHRTDHSPTHLSQHDPIFPSPPCFTSLAAIRVEKMQPDPGLYGSMPEPRSILPDCHKTGISGQVLLCREGEASLAAVGIQH